MNDKKMKTRSPFFCPQFFCQLLTALLLAPLAGLQAADKPAKPNPGQSAGVDPDDGTAPRPEKTVPPRLIPNPNSTEDYARAKRTCSGVPSLAVSRGGRLWAAWFSGTTPGEIIERCPHAYVVDSTSGDGGKTWKEVLAVDPDGAGWLEIREGKTNLEAGLLSTCQRRFVNVWTGASVLTFRLGDEIPNSNCYL